MSRLAHGDGASLWFSGPAGGQGDVHIIATYGHRKRRYGRGFGQVHADPIVQVEAPAMPHTRDRAIVQGAIVERRGGMWTDVFHGVKLSLVSEDRDKALTHTKFTPLPFRDVLDTGESDRA